MNQSNNTGYQNLLFNNQFFRSGLDAIQNDPQFSGLRSNGYFMQMLNMMQNTPENVANVMMMTAQTFLGIPGFSMGTSGTGESSYAQQRSQGISNKSHDIDKLQRKKMDQDDKEIDTLEIKLESYKESRKKLINENNSIMQKLKQDSQDIE